MQLTTFKNNKCKVGTINDLEWDDIASYFDADDVEIYPAKVLLPLIKFALFDENIRSNKTVKAITGIEGDYDLGEISLGEAYNLLHAADFKCFIVPTSSWTEDVPKWRVYAPFRTVVRRTAGWEDLARKRNNMLNRINGVLGGVFSGESAVVGQIYYFGMVDGGHTEQGAVLESERYIDDCEELDAGAMPTSYSGGGGGAAGTGTIKEDDLSLDNVFEDQAGQKKELREWLPLMAEHGDGIKIRVQTIWRDSDSFAAFMRFTDDRRPVVHDMGSGISHFLERRWIGEADDLVGNTTSMLEYDDPHEVVIGQETPLSTCILMSLSDMDGNLVHITKGNRYALRFKPREVYGYSEVRAMLKGNATGGGRNAQESFEIWSENPKRIQVSTITFLPGVGQFLRDPEGAQALNMWLPLSRPQMKAHVAELQAELFLNHITYLFGDRTDDFLDWLAHIEQRPDVLPHTFWLHISPAEGTGRSWLASVLDRVWSPYAATGLDLAIMMEGQFNERLSGKLLAVVEEIKEGGRGAWQHNQRLKSWITEDIRLINPKGHPEYREFNRVRWLMFSNHLSAIPLAQEDRRTEVVICNKEPHASNYYEKLYKAREEKEFIQAVGAYLANRNIKRFNPGAKAKYTKAKERATSLSQSREDRVVEAIKEHWKLPIISAANLLGALTGEEESDHGTQVNKLRSYMNVFFKAGVISRKTGKKNRRLTLYSVEPEVAGSLGLLVDRCMSQFGDDIFERYRGVQFAEEFIDNSEV